MEGARRNIGLTIGYRALLDFCVGVLELDGLRVDPFDLHEGGSGALRALGLSPDDWRNWVRTVVGEQRRLLTAKVLTRERTTRDEIAEAALPSNPLEVVLEQVLPTVWPENPGLRAALLELWRTGLPVSSKQGEDAWEQWTELEGHLMTDTDVMPALMRRLSEVSKELSALQVFHVDYQGPVAYFATPEDLLLAVRGWKPTTQEYVDFVAESMINLSADD